MTCVIRMHYHSQVRSQNFDKAVFIVDTHKKHFALMSTSQVRFSFLFGYGEEFSSINSAGWPEVRYVLWPKANENYLIPSLKFAQRLLFTNIFVTPYNQHFTQVKALLPVEFYIKLYFPLQVLVLFRDSS